MTNPGAEYFEKLNAEVEDEILAEGVIDFASMFKAYEALNEKEWKYDRRASLGASEVFQCLRKSFFAKWGYEPDDDHEDDWGAAKRGDIIENYFAVPALRAILECGERLTMEGDTQETLRIGRLSATLDGLVVDCHPNALAQLGIDDLESDCFVAEFKSFDPRANINEEKAIHRGQTQVQMGILHELTEHRPEYAVIFYFNASWLSDIKFYVVKRDPKIYEIAKKRAQLVFTDQDPADVDAEGKIDDTCNLCSFHEECAIASKASIPTTKRKIESEDDMNELARLALLRDEAKRAMDDAEGELKSLNKAIKDFLRKHDTKGAGDPRFNVSLSWNKGKKSTDLLAMQADGIDVEAYQNEGHGFEVLRVTWKGNGPSD
ncbi:exonuclease [Citromicrobium phage vB_CbaS-RXM]|nr:exonuclease [Citromicrobium phage vB_CbaS-RXM]